MHFSGADNPARAGRDSGPAAGERRFDGESARRILERAAVEQQRLNNDLAGSYTLAELEAMAAEAGISPDALRAAIEAQGRGSARRQSTAASLMPGNWSRAVRGGVLATAGSIGFLGVLVAFPMVAEIVLWALLSIVIVLAVLVALGASPF